MCPCCGSEASVDTSLKVEIPVSAKPFFGLLNVATQGFPWQELMKSVKAGGLFLSFAVPHCATCREHDVGESKTELPDCSGKGQSVLILLGHHNRSLKEMWAQRSDNPPLYNVRVVRDDYAEALLQANGDSVIGSVPNAKLTVNYLNPYADQYFIQEKL
jgi:hypothetical protein